MMTHLKQITQQPEITYYQLLDDDDNPVERYVISTPGTRKICNIPELLGVEYTVLMQEAMVAALKNLPGRDLLLENPQEQFCVFTFLRGGLNFSLREALYHAYGFNRHASAFMTSQRKLIDGKWHIRENQYRKLKVPEYATVLLGDVVATGTTLDIGFNIFLDHLRANRSRLNNLIFFTIGCKNAEEILQGVDKKLRAMNPLYGRTIVIYIEGRFGVADKTTGLKIQIPGTDLIRINAQVSPEFALSQYENTAYPLERCTIYDAGSRSFDIPEYMHDVVDFWKQTQSLAQTGFTLHDALKERWPEDGWEDFGEFSKKMARQWQGVDEKIVADIHAAYKKRWDRRFKAQSKSKDALVTLCEERLVQLSRF
ncbi:MAG: hypothetical protein DSY89_11095 [Deltaproteobacteria bacterium]|nr:MAG: hypothetical protein DSY89_11095 [Deltaproteobacteria bacterium]